MSKLVKGLGLVLLVLAIKFGAVTFKGAVRYVTRRGIDAAEDTLRPADPANLRIMARHLVALGEIPELRARTQGKSEAEVAQIGALLERNGTRRLDGEPLRAIVDVRARVLAAADSTRCAALARSAGVHGEDEATRNVIMALDSATLETYLSATRQAIVAELRQTKPRQLTDDQLTEAMLAVYRRLPESQRARLTAGYVQSATASDADACWATRTLLRAWTALPEPQKTVLALAIIE